jgi:hypothetical protein
MSEELFYGYVWQFVVWNIIFVQAKKLLTLFIP